MSSHLVSSHLRHEVRRGQVVTEAGARRLHRLHQPTRHQLPLDHLVRVRVRVRVRVKVRVGVRVRVRVRVRIRVRVRVRVSG